MGALQHVESTVASSGVAEELILVRIKWHLWRGKTENALIRLDSFINDCPKTYKQRLETLKTYFFYYTSAQQQHITLDYRAKLMLKTA